MTSATIIIFSFMLINCLMADDYWNYTLVMLLCECTLVHRSVRMNYQMDKNENKRYIVVAFIYDIRNYYTMKIVIDFVRKYNEDQLYINSIDFLIERKNNERNLGERAKKRGSKSMGTLGSGNHFLELQVVDRIVDVLGLGYEVVCMPYLKREVFTFECFLKTGL